MSLDARVLNLAQAVSDGMDVDWDHAESSAADNAERLVVTQLRHLATVSQAARAQAAPWGPLEIRQEVGKGSFGTVYRAWDPRLDREVALKLLGQPEDRRELSSAFIREGRMLARLRHPNVVTVHGADQHNGSVGIWMEFVAGRTLKEIVQEHGPLGPHEAALIGRDLCRALAAVHKLGFFHRDIKAQNVMREAGGRIVLMDFGSSVDSSGAPYGLAGTPAYLAPELLQGSPVSLRSDIYSLGVLLYYLVTARFPVTGGSLDELKDRHAAGQRTLLRDARPDLSDEFVRAVDSAIAADPHDRPESAGAFERLLERALGLQVDQQTPMVDGIQGMSPSRHSTRIGRWAYWVAAVLVTAGATAALFKPWRSGLSSVVVRRDSVAIMPFATVGDSTDGESLTAGIAQDVVAHLASLRNLRIIAGTSALRYKDGTKTPVEIGTALGVATVLDGSVQRVDDRLHVVVRLVDSSSGEQLWSDVFDRDVRDVFSMQSEISRKIAIALRGELSQAETERLRPSQGHDFEAFTLYAKGRQHWTLRTEDDVNRAIQYFQEAIQRDPAYAPAYAGLSDAYTSLGAYGVLPRAEAWKRAAEAAERALALDATLAEAHASLGFAQKNRFEWRAAEASFKQAIALRPGAPLPHHWYAILLMQLGRFPEAITEIKAAIALDPLSIGANLQFASVLLMAHRYEDAIGQWQHALQLDPSFVNAYRGMASAYGYLGMYDKALAQAAEAARRSAQGGDDQDLKTDLACVLAAAGRRDEALQIANAMKERYETTGEGLAGSIAAIFGALRQPELALHWLTIATAQRDPEVGYLKVDPRWDFLRTDPRFEKLMSDVGLADKR